MARIAVIDDRVTNRNILTRLAPRSRKACRSAPSRARSRRSRRSTAACCRPDHHRLQHAGDGRRRFVRALRQRRGAGRRADHRRHRLRGPRFCYRALEAGATDFLLSPVDHLEFRARARNLLTLRRQQLLLADRAADLERALTRPGRRRPARTLLSRVLDAMPGRDLDRRRAGPPRLVNQALRGAARHRPRQDGARPPAGRDSHGEDYALRSGVRDEKVLRDRRAGSRARATTR